MMAKIYRDELNREFVDLSTLSNVLGCSPRNTWRLIRTHNWLSERRGKVRFVLKQDFLATFPDLSPTLLSRLSGKDPNNQDIKDTNQDIKHKLDVPDVPIVPDDRLSNVSQDRDIIEFEKVTDGKIFYEKTLATIQRLEKTLATMAYIHEDTRKIDRKLDRQAKEIKDLAGKIQRTGKARLNTRLEAVVLVAMLLLIGFLFLQAREILNSFGV